MSAPDKNITSVGLAVWGLLGSGGTQAWLTHADASRVIGGSSQRMTIERRNVHPCRMKT